MSKLASIERIKSIEPHPNADRLELAHVLGYTCVIPKDKYSEGSLVVLIQPDTVLPDQDWAEFYKKFSKNRVKAAKLRGVWSYGIVESLNIIPCVLRDIYEGKEVENLIGITKYEAPQPTELNAKGAIPYSIPKTDEERWQNVGIESLLGQLVDVTLKVDGQSFTALYKDGYFGVCGRSLEYKLECHNNYTAHVKRYNLEEKLVSYCEKHQVNIALRGESYGKGIQVSNNNPHSKLNNGVLFFSVYLIDEHRYASPSEQHSVANVCAELDLPLVPVIEKSVPLTYELIKKYDEELTQINGLPFEGVVIAGDGFSFKVINKQYDSKK
jgi:RNA ligase (TIGR02306 family)